MKEMFWVNTPVLMKAISAYEDELLPHSLELWVEDILEINKKEDRSVINNHT
jgi:hypothetical protein